MLCDDGTIDTMGIHACQTRYLSATQEKGKNIGIA